MPRGGKTQPPLRTPPGGPGRFSRRTDAQRVPKTPGLGGGEAAPTDLQYGDVQRLESAQRIAPLPQGVPNPKGGPERRPTGTPIDRTGRIPKHLLTMQPEINEPTTSGLDVGPGPGSDVLMSPTPAPDIREDVLEYLWLTYRNADAFRMLNELRQGRSVQPPSAPVVQQPAPVAPPRPVS